MKTIVRFVKHSGNPIIPRTPGTFYSVYAANADLLDFRGKFHLYFRGQAEDGHDRIGVGRSEHESFDGATWEILPNPVVPLGDRLIDHDSQHTLDPAAVIWKGQVYLYYTAYSAQPGRVFSTGLAVSSDGIHFERRAQPVVTGAGPEVVIHGDAVHLFYHRVIPGAGIRAYCSVSRDGEHFSEDREIEVFKPSERQGEFDSFSIATCRIWREGRYYYMTYAGGRELVDYPEAIGLARSEDLLTWQRYPDNPILTRGEPGEWDEGALWFATVHRVGDIHYLWYEGGGAGLGVGTPEGREASRLVREKGYGGYGKTAFSQIGLATFRGEMPGW